MLGKMDKEQAKFILQSFRPDGADAHDPEFTEALRLAAEDRELGEWLAQERAEDAAFASALNGLPIPAELRDEIFAVLEFDGARHDDEGDEVFVGALASVKIPDNLRDQILNAMEVELAESDKGEKVVKFPWMPILAGLAAAVVLSVGSYVMFTPEQGSGPSAVAQIPMLDSYSVQMEMGKVLRVSTDEIGFEYTPQPGEGLKDVSSWLGHHQHPLPESIPQGLENADIIGSKQVLLTTGHKASLVTFHKNGVGEMHMIILDAKTVEDLGSFDELDKVGMKNCESCPISEFVITRWKDSENAYILLAKAEPIQVQGIF